MVALFGGQDCRPDHRDGLRGVWLKKRGTEARAICHVGARAESTKGYAEIKRSVGIEAVGIRRRCLRATAADYVVEFQITQLKLDDTGLVWLGMICAHCMVSSLEGVLLGRSLIVAQESSRRRDPGHKTKPAGALASAGQQGSSFHVRYAVQDRNCSIP